MHLKELTNAGLSENEAKVYLAALELGETSVYRLAKKSSIKRTTTYLAVETLKEKGLISTYSKNNVIVCYAENPKKLVRALEEKKTALDKIMPELLAFNNLIDCKPQIHFFEGESGIQEVYKDTLNYPNQEILLWGTDNFVTYSDENYFLEHYIPKRKEKNIWVRAIAPKTEIIEQYQEKNLNQLRKMKIVQMPGFKFSVEIDLYGKNKIMIASFQEKFGMIIESQKMHETLRSIFEIMWAILPQNKPADTQTKTG